MGEVSRGRCPGGMSRGRYKEVSRGRCPGEVSRGRCHGEVSKGRHTEGGKCPGVDVQGDVSGIVSSLYIPPTDHCMFGQV